MALVTCSILIEPLSLLLFILMVDHSTGESPDSIAENGKDAADGYPGFSDCYVLKPQASAIPGQGRLPYNKRLMSECPS